MNRDEAKRILSLYRRGTSDDADPLVMTALDLARHDQELQQWFEQQESFHVAMREKLRAVEPPADLKARLLATVVLTKPVFWRRPAVLALAAAVVILLGLASVWMQGAPKDHFRDYRARMVRAALREYSMDIMTNDPVVIRQHLAAHNSPTNYVVPPGLGKLPPTGAGALTWRGNPVSMVCFDRGDSNMLFLFVIDRRAVKTPPPLEGISVSPVNKLTTLNWSDGANAYFLAGTGPAEALTPYGP